MSGDTVALSDARVGLHRVRGREGAMVDSASTDASGQYRFTVLKPDTSVRYYVSAEYADIGYFSTPLNPASGASDTVPTIFVYDTSYASPEIELSERHIIVRRRADDGSRQIIELITLRNVGARTRIAADTSTPVWQGTLPPGAYDLAVGESEVGSGAVYGRAGALAIAAPIPPGEKQVLFSYLLPDEDGALLFPVDQQVGRFTVSLADTSATATGPGIVLYGVEEVGGTAFKRYDGGRLAAGTQVSVQFVTSMFTTERLEVVFVLSVVAMLGGTLFWWLGKQKSAV